jgi:hypothetical protein
MSGFDDIAMSWKGQEYRVPPNRCMGLLAAVEDVLAPGGRGDILGMLGNPHQAHLTRLARAYAAALRYAGCKTMQAGPDGTETLRPISDEEVYLSMSREMQQGGMHAVNQLQAMASGLLMLFFPDWAKEEPLGKTTGEAVDDQTEEPATPSAAQSSDAA